MIRHIVLFKLKPPCSFDDDRVLVAERLAQQVGEEVPVLKRWSTGRNLSTGRAQAYDFMVEGHLETMQDVDSYLADPFHQKAVAAWREISDWVVIDIAEGDGCG
ncbi:MAG: Dabb family protein [Propionibacteriaceae bacterium]|nr:Dabb family protein [Propionibacteriaceae bacterium]